ncbi:restriction endonuclease subunit S [Emticicia sp. 17c]|uniref:restriction endonuclease subunit S n=1 Tax=Emticicia sp. 17c TaxID=3127704 RepID=UPI00301C5B1E
MAKISKKITNVPNLRFPEFEGEWEEKKLGEVLDIGSGRDYKHLQKGDIPVFGTGGYITSVNDYLFDGESVCIGRKGTINKPFYYNGKFWTVDTLFYTHSYKHILSKFILYIFENINWLKYNEASGVPSLSKSTIEQIAFFQPNISEQKKISSFLSLIDERIQTQIQIIEKLETLIKGICQKVIYSKIPNKKLKDCVNYHSSSLTETDISDKNGIYPVYGATGLISYIPYYLIDEEAIMIIKDGAGVGKVQYGNGKFSVIGTLNYLTAKEQVYLRYIFYCLKFFNFDKYKVGSGIPHIYFKDYGETIIPFPTLKEQERIANFLLTIEEKINVERILLQDYEIQKKYLLQKLFI